jgi:hypothetical protein
MLSFEEMASLGRPEAAKRINDRSPLPRIAIPEPTSTDTAYNQRSLPQYIHAVEAAGGIAVPISLHESAESQAGTHACIVLGDPAAGQPGGC